MDGETVTNGVVTNEGNGCTGTGWRQLGPIDYSFFGVDGTCEQGLNTEANGHQMRGSGNDGKLRKFHNINKLFNWDRVVSGRHSCTGVTAGVAKVTYQHMISAYALVNKCFESRGQAGCADWSVPAGHTVLAWGDIIRIGWHDTQTQNSITFSGPTSAQLGYPKFTSALNAKLSSLCTTSQQAVHVAFGVSTPEQSKLYGIKEADRYNVHFLAVYFPCAGLEGNPACVQGANNMQMAFRFAVQVLVETSSTGTPNFMNG